MLSLLQAPYVWLCSQPGSLELAVTRPAQKKPPAENADSVLNFEDIDKLPADDLDRITAWMESMLASLCQLNNVRVDVLARLIEC